MKTLVRLAGAATVSLAAVAAVAGPAVAAPASTSPTSSHRAAGAVFVQSDDPDANTVVAYARRADGTLRQAGTYRTGGRGGVLDGSVVDHLASQGSLALDKAHGLLLAVNAGSNSVTVFAVHGDRLARRQVIASGGEFPVSLSVRGDLVYVLNARGGGSVQGYRLNGGRLHRVNAWHRDLGLDPSATPEFTHTPGQAAITPDGRALVVTTKANGSAFEVFRLAASGAPSAQPVLTPDPDAVPFAMTFDHHGRVVVAEAGTNAVATFRVERDGTLTLLGRAATGQAATCWIVRSGRNLYASNAGSATVSGFRIEGPGALVLLGNTSTGGGTVDAATTSNGRYLYVQTGAAGGVDAFRVASDGGLRPLGSVLVPGAAGGEGIVAS
ncbi:lactonase family protein [Angustibacter sp. McL0619]|uniref:lactonase family protein n=1 Tax=Angustibacter sp. McL0619 TaxID=3415676 RepID=UPI003CE77AB6